MVDQRSISTEVKTAVLLKLLQLQRESLSKLTYDELMDTIEWLCWRQSRPMSLSKCVDDVMSVSADDIIKYLSLKAMKCSEKLNMDDLSDLLGGLD